MCLVVVCLPHVKYIGLGRVCLCRFDVSGCGVPVPLLIGLGGVCLCRFDMSGCGAPVPFLIGLGVPLQV